MKISNIKVHIFDKLEFEQNSLECNNNNNNFENAEINKLYLKFCQQLLSKPIQDLCFVDFFVYFIHFVNSFLNVFLNIKVFEKALDEPKYSSMYAQLCLRLSEEAPNFDDPGKTGNSVSKNYKINSIRITIYKIIIIFMNSNTLCYLCKIIGFYH